MELFEEIFNLLPDYIKDDEIFKTIMEPFFEYIKNNLVSFTGFASNIRVSEHIFSMLDLSKIKELPPIKSIFTTGSDTDHCYSILTGQNFTLSLRIKGDEKEYKVILDVINNVPYKPTKNIRYTYVKKNGLGVIEENRETQDSSFYLDYSYDVKAFKNGVPYPIIDVENIKDREFIDRFGVDENKVRLYRTNFKKYAKEINDSIGISFSNFLNDEVEKNWSFKKFEDFDDFIDFMKKQTIDSSRYQKLLSIISNNKDLLDSTFIISTNILDIISFYLGKFQSTLYCRGTLIKKINDEYKMLYLLLDENTFIVTETNVSSKKAQKYFNETDYYKDYEISEDDIEFDDEDEKGLI